MIDLLLGGNPISKATTIFGFIALTAGYAEQYSRGEISVYALVVYLAGMVFARLTDESWVKNISGQVGGYRGGRNNE
jgi:hypothetical protein